MNFKGFFRDLHHLNWVLGIQNRLFEQTQTFLLLRCFQLLSTSSAHFMVYLLFNTFLGSNLFKNWIAFEVAAAAILETYKIGCHLFLLDFTLLQSNLLIGLLCRECSILSHFRAFFLGYFSGCLEFYYSNYLKVFHNFVHGFKTASGL